jgi:hypothetical protein
MSASPALRNEHPDVAAWRQAFSALKPSVSPCPGLAGPKWQVVHAAALDFLDFYADEAVGLGWTTLQLFGVHPELGVLRSDFCGALVLSGEKVSGVEPNRLMFHRTNYRRDVPGVPSGGIPLWAFKR